MKLIAVPFALLFASTAFAQETSAPTAPAAPAAPVKEKKVCRRGEIPIGSITPVTTCHTKSEWAAIDQQNERNKETMLDVRPNGTPHP